MLHEDLRIDVEGVGDGIYSRPGEWLLREDVERQESKTAVGLSKHSAPLADLTRTYVLESFRRGRCVYIVVRRNSVLGGVH
jgi:hypothetical protein